MKLLECCLNGKVLAGLGAIALGIAIFQPHLLLIALPTLAVALCPLSMGIMALGMWRQQRPATAMTATAPPPPQTARVDATAITPAAACEPAPVGGAR